MIFDEYASYLRTYKAEFGEQTIVLFECGSFFEIYDDGSCETNMKEISELLNIVVSRRNKSILEVSKNNFEMAGFPSHALKKFVNILVSNNYTVVLVRQVTPPPNPQRKVTDVLSPGVCIDVQSCESNNLMVVYLEANERYDCMGYDMAIGCAVIDVTTGKTHVYETSNYKKDPCYCYDELYRLIHMYNPKEIELMSEPSDHIQYKTLLENVDMRSAYIHDKIGTQCGQFKKLAYQREVLEHVFQEHGLLDVISFLELERKPLATIAFTRMLQFVHMHNETILERIRKPDILCEDTILLLSYTAVQQLDIANKNKGKCDSLLNLLNNSKTAIGKRYFKHRLLNPLFDTVRLQEEYDAVDMLSYEHCLEIRNILNNVYDVERLFRKAMLKVLHPHELYNVYKSIEAIQGIQGISQHDIVHHLSAIIDYIQSYFDVTHMQMYNADAIQPDMLVLEKFADIASLQCELNKYICIFEEFVKKVPDACIKLEYSERDGYSLSTTQKRFQDFIVKPKIQVDIGNAIITWKDLTTKSFTNNIKLYHKVFEDANTKIIAYKAKISHLCEAAYKILLKEFCDTYASNFDAIVKYIEYIDFLTTRKYNVHLYKLARPTFSSSQPASFARIHGVRHLLIENLHNDVKYVSNDVCVGDSSQLGILLYGINSSGKSSLMKAVGIAIIMAQAGMYVACDSMELCAYKKIFTRILSSDDIFRGQSTFTKEILELRNILKRADAHSLVIGDELCSGTESASALSIVSAGIITLVKKRSSFLFATHLHDLNNVEEVTSLTEVKSYHLSVHHDETLNTLVYDRKLKPGSGSSLYGIEVCKALDMDKEFIELANKIRQKNIGVYNQLDVGKASRYNAHVFLTYCKVCGNKADHIHHIDEQHKADDEGYIGAYHKNNKFNLVSLCESCHHEVHTNTICIKGYVQTDTGVQLDFYKIAPSKAKNDSGADASMEHDIVKLFKDEHSRFITKKQKYAYACEKYNITKYKVNKILSENTY